MRRIVSRILIGMALSVLVVSCKDKEEDFDENLLVGKWVEGTEYYRYDDSHSGVTWDTGEDMSEEEALPFTWSLSGTRFVHYHIMEGGQIVPQTYTMTKLSSTLLEYRDASGYNHHFSKLN
ncbi:MAG: hypothetical protein J5873_01935 [Bacteroidales bacterium]|nr:hypothetical protein [Bacteroidales bacterium]